MKLAFPDNLYKGAILLLPNESDIKFEFGNLAVTILSISRDPIDCNMFYIDHCHDSSELRFVQDGLGYVKISGTNITVSKNDMYIVGPKLIHRRRSDTKNPLVELCIKYDLKLKDKNCKHTPDELNLFEVLTKPCPYIFKTTNKIVESLNELIWCLIEKPSCFMIYAKTIFLQLLIKVYNTIISHRQVEYEASSVKEESSLQDLRMRKIIDYVELNINNNIKISNIATILDLSPRQINRVMNRYFGMTFGDYLEKYKLEMAKELLHRTDRTISDIAFMSGFTSHQQMYRLFKTKLLCSPIKYRQLKVNQFME